MCLFVNKSNIIQYKMSQAYILTTNKRMPIHFIYRFASSWRYTTTHFDSQFPNRTFFPLPTKLRESQRGNIRDSLFSNYMYNILIYDYGTKNN